MSDRPRRHRQAEAFHRMKYECTTCGRYEWIWNSRDGVTPFGIQMRCGHDGTHVEWHKDQYLPGYIPDVGERVFVTLTLEKARQYRQPYVEAHWEGGEYPMRDSGMFASKEDAVEKLAAHDVASFAPDTPDLVTVTLEMSEAFRAREAAR